MGEGSEGVLELGSAVALAQQQQRMQPAWMLKLMDPRREAEQPGQPAELLNVDAHMERQETQHMAGVEVLGADIWVSSVEVP